jgi:3-mercaptopyruvate sulfurtransferase SseA
MSKTKIILVLSILILTTAACNAIAPTVEPTQTAVVIIEPTTPPQKSSLPANEASVPRVEVEKAKAAFDSGEAIIVDVRSKQAYDASHVAGAINIQLGEFETNINGLTLDKNQWIITYCT